jgi:agmatinase
MPLRDAPTPRMAGHLPFMRAPMADIDRLEPGQVAAFGVPLGCGAQDTSLGPLALRETSVYFGSHFTANMKAAMDVDRRMVLGGAAIAGALVDLGDIDFARIASPVEDCIASLAAAVVGRGAIPAMLGGHRASLVALRRGIETALGREVAIASPRARDDGGPEDAVLVAIDLSDVASVWHGGSVVAGFDGLTLSQTRTWLRGFGSRRVAGMAVTGLDPMRQGLSTVKTGQRLLVTAILDLIYARLDALTPYASRHG